MFTVSFKMTLIYLAIYILARSLVKISKRYRLEETVKVDTQEALESESDEDETEEEEGKAEA